jgi:hypothetical protein
MSDKVTQLYPARERRRKIVRAIVSLAVVVMLAAGATAVILFRQELNLDKLRRYVTYLNVKDSGTFGKYTFDAHSGNAYAPFGDGLALASVGGLDVYDDSGKELWNVSAAMEVPAVSVGNGAALAWDVGGTSLNVVGLKKGVLLKKTTDKTLLDADISGGNAVCYATAADGYKTLLTVLDAGQKETYHWYSSSQYLPLCAVSDDGKSLAAVGLGKKDASFESSGILLRTDRDKPVATVSLGSQLILDLDFLADGKLCAVGEDSARFFGTDGKDLGTYDYAGGYLRNFDFGGDGFLTLSLNMNKAGSRYAVATVGADGAELARKEIDAEVLSVSAVGGYVAVLTPGALTIYTSDLKQYAQTKEVSGASKALMRKDGTAILVGSGEAHLYLP